MRIWREDAQSFNSGEEGDLAASRGYVRSPLARSLALWLLGRLRPIFRLQKKTAQAMRGRECTRFGQLQSSLRQAAFWRQGPSLWLAARQGLPRQTRTWHTSKDTRARPLGKAWQVPARLWTWAQGFQAQLDRRAFSARWLRQFLPGLGANPKGELLLMRICKRFKEIGETPAVLHWRCRMEEIDPSGKVKIGLAIWGML